MAVALHAGIAQDPMGPIASAPLTPLATVNDDLLNAVTCFLSIEDVLAAAKTSRAMHRSILEHTTYWRDLELEFATSELLLELLPFTAALRRLRFHKSSASTEVWLSLAERTSGLTVLDVSGSKYVTDDVFRLFCSRNRATLQHIAADNCSWISSLAPLAPFAGQLRSLSFNRCRQLVTNDVLAIATEAPLLEVLELKGNPKVNPSPVITTTLAACPRLTVLTLGGSGRFTKDINHEFIGAFEKRNQALALECLDLSCSNPFGSRSPLADDGLLALLNLCPQLQALYLKGQSNLSSALLSNLPSGLRRLDVTGCSLLTTNLAALAQLPLLEELVLYACDNVTDDDLRRLRESNARLVKVDVEGCTAVTDAARDLFHL
ncbi:hypothetical protein ACHHYP_08642 [Achlya hypogyna]|uniref:F-box domain-containing protein n=1 Tax=Achlya hypogyna TaxID=1202772 RepID=A0A1V9ZKA9_ACHHY|nr:hypothetical protein ACHHYP_08642 [Achlya hypogyna]